MAINFGPYASGDFYGAGLQALSQAPTATQSFMTGSFNPITAGIGGALGLAQGLFGTGSSTTQRSRTELTPQDIQGIRAAQSTYQGMFPGLLTDLQARQKAVLTGVQAPQTGFQYQAPDALTKALAAQAAQGMAQQATAQRQRIAQQFRGQPGAAMALMAQADIQNRLQQNPLLFQAFQQQQQRELLQAQQQMAQQQAANEAIMAREQMAANLGLMQPQAQANLLNTLLQLGQAFGTQVTEQKSRGGGLFG